MDLNVYSVVAGSRALADARARVAREVGLRSLRPPRRPWRVTLGLALIGLGRRSSETAAMTR